MYRQVALKLTLLERKNNLLQGILTLTKTVGIAKDMVGYCVIISKRQELINSIYIIENNLKQIPMPTLSLATKTLENNAEDIIRQIILQEKLNIDTINSEIIGLKENLQGISKIKEMGKHYKYPLHGSKIDKVK